MSWTIRCDDMTTVTAFSLPGGPSSLGYVTRESDKCAPCQEDFQPIHCHTRRGICIDYMPRQLDASMQWPLARHALATHNI